LSATRRMRSRPPWDCEREASRKDHHRSGGLDGLSRRKKLSFFSGAAWRD
jgi:hypothetical protein